LHPQFNMLDNTGNGVGDGGCVMASRIEFSACVNHPAVEAAARCKACLKPICNACKVMGSTGVFCSPACKEKYESFVERAAKMDQMPKPKAFNMARIRSIVVKFVILLVLLAALAVGASFLGIDVPIVGEYITKLRALAGM
jgi:hypothetical protein